jgi:hypothetical protein
MSKNAVFEHFFLGLKKATIFMADLTESATQSDSQKLVFVEVFLVIESLFDSFIDH